MGRWEEIGLNNLLLDMRHLELTSDKMVEEMLEAESDIMAEAIRGTATTMLSGPFSTGDLADSVTKGKVVKETGRVRRDIVFEGSQHGWRNNAIAYINEYGKTNQEPRPFIQTAVEMFGPKALEAAQKVYENHLKEIGL